MTIGQSLHSIQSPPKPTPVSSPPSPSSSPPVPSGGSKKRANSVVKRSGEQKQRAGSSGRSSPRAASPQSMNNNSSNSGAKTALVGDQHNKLKVESRKESTATDEGGFSCERYNLVVYGLPNIIPN